MEKILLGFCIGLLLALVYCFLLVCGLAKRLEKVEEDILMINSRIDSVLEHDRGILELNAKILGEQKKLVDRHAQWCQESLDKQTSFEKMYDRRLEELEQALHE